MTFILCPDWHVLAGSLLVVPPQPCWGCTWADRPCGSSGARDPLPCTWWCARMCPDVGQPLTESSCLMAVGPAEAGEKVRATCKCRLWMFGHLWTAALCGGMLTLGRSSSSSSARVGRPYAPAEGHEGFTCCGSAVRAQLESIGRNQGHWYSAPSLPSGVGFILL